MRRLVALVLAGGAALLGAPSPTGATPHGWPTFGFDVQRRGRNPDTREVGPQQARRLTEWWSTAVGSAAINAQPVVALDVELPGGPADVVFIAAEDGWITALEMSTGEVVWRRYVGAARPGPVRGCPGYPDQVFGVTGTPVIERSRGRIYVVGGDDRAYALRLADGATVPGWPVAVADPAGEHVWSGLTLWRHVLYAAVASYCDMPPYTGTRG